MSDGRLLAASRSLAVLILLGVGGGAAAPLLPPGRGGCAMCREKCCCAPRVGAEAICRLGRPCDTETPSTSPLATGDGKAVLRGEALPVAPPATGASIRTERPAVPADRAQTPPDPPPRAGS